VNVGADQTITLIPGDGIGTEITKAVVDVLDAAGFKPEWETVAAGESAIRQYNTPLPEEAIRSIAKTRVALKGPLRTPIGTGYKSVNVLLRQHFMLYACYRPIQSLDGIVSKWKDLDLVIIRENTEGLYAGIEHEVIPGVVESLKIVTRNATERIARFAYDYARRAGRRKVTIVHKANIMKLSDGLFLDVSKEIGRLYPEIETNDCIVDNACMQLILKPEQFDILLLENLYGDIVSDLAAGLVGGLGIVPAANYGADCNIFEAVHGTAPDIAGKGIANPTALLRSAILMLEFLNQSTIASNVDRAFRKVLREGKTVTPDLGGKATTDEMSRAIIDSLDGREEARIAEKKQV
jgi:isocitrate dehydrogenase (NAD+)